MIILNLTKNVEQNAGQYFEKAKKIKKKIRGAELALARSRAGLESLLSKRGRFSPKPERAVLSKKKEWYENFRWFITSGGHLVIGGRDSTTNDIIIKKHMQPEDIVFHAEFAGSPFCVIKTNGKEVREDELKEAAQFCAANSRAFKRGISFVDVYHIKPEQVSKKAPSGEYIGKGAFMIYGKKNFINAMVKISVGILSDGRVMLAPEPAVKRHCVAYLGIEPGSIKKSEIAKKIQKIFEKKSNLKIGIDDIIRVLPPGESKIA